MADVCPACNSQLAPGEELFQLARGTYHYPAITPTYSFPLPIIGEWHRRCFADYPLQRQQQPYMCAVCRAEIENRQQVVYGVFGTKPAHGYIRPERRGYELYLVAHEECWIRRP